MTRAPRPGPWIALACSALFGCSHETHFLGYDQTALTGQPPLTATSPPADAGPSAGSGGGLGGDDDPAAAGAGAAGDGAGGTGGNAGQGARPGEGGNGGIVAGNGGEDGDGGEAPDDPDEPDAGVVGGSGGTPGTTTNPPNHLVDVLGRPPAAVERQIEEAFQQLFHGDPRSEAIYVEVGDGSAYIFDVHHDDTRADALGFGLLISALLDKQMEFDAVWLFTKNHAQFSEGPKQGYLHGTCDESGSPCSEEVGTFGGFHAVTGLFIAEARWGNGDGIYDYGGEARALLDAFRNKETHNGGVVEGVINIFGPEALPHHEPNEAFAMQVRPGSLMPGYFQYWGELTGDDYWYQAAERARALLRSVANPDIGLTPGTVYFDGTFVEGESDFKEPSYNVAFNIAVDWAWYAADPGLIDIANRLVRFFDAFGGSYPSLFTYDGGALSQNPSGALVALNGAAAGIATIPARERFIRTVSETPIQTGAFRYFDGINQLLSLMYLAGYVRPYY